MRLVFGAICLAFVSFCALAATPPPVTLITWNIERGYDAGDNSDEWPQRKRALQTILESEHPAIFCAQEVTEDQFAFLKKLWPNYEQAGRPDTQAKPERVAIFFDAQRFKLVESGTFWFGETPDQPSPTWDNSPNRCCTWIRLEDRATERNLRIFTAHFPHSHNAQEKCARLLTARIAQIHPEEPMVLCGDFNNGPGSTPWKIIAENGLMNCERAAGFVPGSKTWQFHGKALFCLDGIFASPQWEVKNFRVLNKAIEGIFPSDHFGLAVELHFKP